MSIDDLMNFIYGIYEFAMATFRYNYCNEEFNEFFCWKMTLEKSIQCNTYQGTY